jgi:thiamine kinase-like enzyme
MGTAQLPADLDSRLDALESLSPGPREVTVLDGGLTNINVRVRTPDRDVVVRISSADSSGLAIDRRAEYLNSLAAAASGASPRVVEFLADQHLLVIDYVDGTTLTPADIRDSRFLPRIAEACRLLHGGPRFVTEFDMFDVQRTYVRTVTDNGYRMPARYLEFEAHVDQIEQALTAVDVPTVPCNNDLLAANFIDDGERLWIIDFEYAGNNDPCFELGNIWSESNLAPEQLDELVTLYFGRSWKSMVARARLLGLMSKYGWTLWASIQDRTSHLDFDFWEWGLEKYERAVEEFESPAFDSWLTAAATPTRLTTP